MRIVNLKDREKPLSLTACGLCLGNFDGVHRGHRALIDELIRMNGQATPALPLGALLFSKPPSLILAPRPVPQLTTLEEKLNLLGEAGLDFAVLYDFEELKDLSPDDFVQQILIGQCHCRLAVCGFNYSYGARGAGTPDTLAQSFGALPGRALSVVAPVTEGDTPISSSAIRILLQQGRPDTAARLLGRPFSLAGRVTNGKHVGGAMGFPTANISFPQWGLVPKHGVYLSRVRIDGKDFYGISNVGNRPTFDDGELINCETFVFDFEGDLYEKTIRVSLLRFLREERRFASEQALREQILADVAQAKTYAKT